MTVNNDSQQIYRRRMLIFCLHDRFDFSHEFDIEDVLDREFIVRYFTH